jgi:hypothetical protein
MKKLFVIFLLLIPISAYSLVVSGVDGGGNADTLEGQNGSYYLDVGNATGTLPPSSFNNISAATVNTTGDIFADGFIDGLKSMGSLSDDNAGLGTPYDMFTTFTIYTSYGATSSSSNVTADASAGTITLDSGVPGEFMFSVDASVTGVNEPELTYAVFRNDTTELISFDRPISGVHHHRPTFHSISGGATFANLTAIRYLYEAEGDQIQINEVNETPGFVYDITFNSNVLYPTGVEFINALYDGNNSGDEVEVRIFSNTSSAYHEMRAAVGDLPDAKGSDAFRNYRREFEVPEPIADYVNVSLRETKIKIIHTDPGSVAHDLYLDKLQLHDAHGTSALSFKHIVALAVGDTISLKIKSNQEAPIYVKNLHFHLGKESN